MRRCIHCHEAIPQGRLHALPDTKVCVLCSEKEGYDERTVGIMSWEHKTAPTLITSDEVGHDGIAKAKKYSRRGVHAQLPFAQRENPGTLASRPVPEGTAEFDSLREGETTTNALTPWVPDNVAALCHADRRRVTPDGKCLECALRWYENRRKR